MVGVGTAVTNYMAVNQTSWGWSFGLTGALKTFPGGVVGWGGWVGWVGEKLGIKLKLSFSWGLGLAELGKMRWVGLWYFDALY